MRLGRDLCGDWNEALRREWLVTNGLGGYACGSVALANTRRYHAFLMAALAPPVERTLLVAKLEVSVDYLGRRYALAANEFADGTVDPHGFVHLESFAVEDGIPVWRYALADALLEQRIFMAPGANVSYLTLELMRASAAARIEIKPLVAYRPMHAHEHGGRAFATVPRAAGCTVRAFDGARPIHLDLDRGDFSAREEWYWKFFHREEAARGLDSLEDLFVPGKFSAQIASGERLALTASIEDSAPPVATAASGLLEGSKARRAALPARAPEWIQALATASDQFLVRRAAGFSVIAGYPWFGDWGRDTMISLPGLATALGRFDIAAGILRTYARFVDRGMLPNRFPDEGTAPEYNTADATLWMFQALHDYLAAKRDPALASELFPVLDGIVQAHVDGTRYGIALDREDGLLRAGEPGIQVTWMDAKHGDRVFTPRVGKAVEINALWLNALHVAARLAGGVRNVSAKRRYEALLERAAAGFRRFWNPQQACLYDVIDVDGGPGVDAGIRPNQLFAVSLPYSALGPEQMRAVVDCCSRELLTSYGLRSLSPKDPRYLGCYRGDPLQRDAAYHQGTVWAWLMGPYVRAHYRVHGDARLAQSFLTPFADHLNAGCLGSISEIFEGDAPHNARGCFAQAWSVAEILHSWIQLEHQIQKSPATRRANRQPTR
ncbi:MAG TPA: amylo-alpha-1,6-glucosidase [Steroidobacteraceae bacterium]|nr:amylo-alpha-1,6-glucosidase [Steroidobacteraceae bacterium]